MRGPARSDDSSGVGFDFSRRHPRRARQVITSRDDRKPPPAPTQGHPDLLAELLGPLEGVLIPGGCDFCDAFQVVRATAVARDVWHLTVYHDDSCPDLAMRDVTWLKA